MTSGNCLIIKAPTTIRALDNGNITGGVKEVISIPKAVAFEERLIGTHAPLKISCKVSIVDKGRIRKAIWAGLFVLANEFAQRSSLETGFEEGGAYDAPKVDMGGSEGMQWVCPRWHAVGVTHVVPNK